MMKLLLLAGAAALVSASPAVAKPGGGHGNGHAGAPHGAKMYGAKMHAGYGAKAKPAKYKQAKYTRAKASRFDRNRNGIADVDEALARRYGGALCPPGLWKKTPSCMPPGQAKRLFRDGQRVPNGYNYYTPYSNIPQPLINQYGLTDQNRYIYRNNMIYVVDPATNLVSRILNGVL
jgi:hypothetical protein